MKSFCICSKIFQGSADLRFPLGFQLSLGTLLLILEPVDVFTLFYMHEEEVLSNDDASCSGR